MLETLLQPNDVEERCGLVLDDDIFVAITNIADDPVKGYEMNPVEVLPHLTAGTITGTWHTHPHSPPQFSGEDYKGFSLWPNLKHYIIGVVDGKTVVNCYEVKDGAIFECA